MKPQDRTRAIIKSSVDSSTRLLLIVIADHMDKAGTCWPAAETLALETRFTARTVKALLKATDDAGITFRRFEDHRSKTISINWKALAAYQPPERKASAGVKHDHPGGCSTITPGVKHDHPWGEARSPEADHEAPTEPTSRSIPTAVAVGTPCAAHDDALPLPEQEHDDAQRPPTPPPAPSDAPEDHDALAALDRGAEAESPPPAPSPHPGQAALPLATVAPAGAQDGKARPGAAVSPPKPPLPADLVELAQGATWGGRLSNCMMAAGHDPSVAVLLAMTEAEVKELPGFGPSSWKHLTKALKRHGLKLATTPEHRRRVAVFEVWKQAGGAKALSADGLGRAALQVGDAFELDPDAPESRARLERAIRRYLADPSPKLSHTLTEFAAPWVMEPYAKEAAPKESYRDMMAKALATKPALRVVGGER